MQRFFNTAGFCNPEKHYTVSVFRGLENQIYNLIREEQYFLLHAPRQTGKTTLLRALAHQLNKEGQYISVAFSLEQAGYESATLEAANERFIASLYIRSKDFLPEEERPPSPDKFKDSNLHDYLVAWCSSHKKQVVLLIDEVDSLYNDVLVSLLRQLRDGFQSRPDNFPASVALVGLRDIREYRLRAKGDNSSLGLGSPFNVKTESFMLKNFTKEDVEELLGQHTAATGQEFPKEAVDLIFHYGAGQPWLTNALAYEIVGRMLERDYSKKITADMVEQAKETLIARRDTHLDSLVDKLRDDRVRRIITAIITGEQLLFDDFSDALLYARNLGIFAPDSPVRFANPIYREITTRIMNSSFQESFNPDDVVTQWYVKADGSLDMDKLLKAFQKFYRRNAESWMQMFEFKEAGQQLLLMAFLQRIVNGGGKIDREMAVGRGRTDVLIEWKGFEYLLELKLKYGSYAKEEGLDQLARYLDQLGLPHGYLVLFEIKPSEIVPWEERIGWEDVVHNGKQITIVSM